MNKNAVKNITDSLGADAICQRLDVSSHSVRHARNTGAFAASWYSVISDMCREVGVLCPLTAFNWRTPNNDGEGE